MYENLLYESESTSLDFKSEQYEFEKSTDEKKGELLKDILAFANARRRGTAYILIGVKDTKCGKAEVVGIDKDLDDAQLQQFVNGKTNIPIEFLYKNINLEGKKVGVLEITHKKRPVYLKKNYGRLVAEVVYYRRGSSTAEASPENIYDMGKDDNTQESSSVDLLINFCDIKNRKVIGQHLSVTTYEISKLYLDDFPDFQVEAHSKNLSGFNHDFMSYKVNNDYYRELFNYYFWSKRIFAFNISVLNKSKFPAIDLKIVASFKKGNGFAVLSPDNVSEFLPMLPKQVEITEKYPRPFTYSREALPKEEKKIFYEKVDDSWVVEILIDKIHPNSTHFVEEKIAIGAGVSFDEDISLKIYGDNIPEPIEKSLRISCEVKKIEGTLDNIMKFHDESMKSK